MIHTKLTLVGPNKSRLQFFLVLQGVAGNAGDVAGAAGLQNAWEKL